MAQEKKFEKAKEFYRQSYYGDSAAPLSMHCGWSSDGAQLSAYGAFLNLFDKSGDVLDLGCGNGALLDFLVSNCHASIHRTKSWHINMGKTINTSLKSQPLFLRLNEQRW